MTTSIRDINTTSDNVNDFGGRHVFNLSNGHVLAVVMDVGVGGNHHIYVYETSDRDTWTLIDTIDPFTEAVGRMTATVDSNNDLHILLMEQDRSKLKYLKMTYADHSNSAWSTVETYTGDDEIRDFDIDVSDSGKVYVAMMYWKGDGSPYGWALYSRPGGTWTQLGSRNLHSNDFNQACESISIIAPKTEVILGNTYESIFVAVGYSDGTKDGGVDVYHPAVLQADNTTLSAGLGATLIKNFASGEANPKAAVISHTTIGTPPIREGRLVRFFRVAGDTSAVMLGIMHAEVNRKMFAIKLNTQRGQEFYDSVVSTATNPIKTANIGARYMGMTVSAKTLMFLYGVSTSKFPSRTVQSWTARLKSNGTFDMFDKGCWFLNAGYITNQSVTLVSSGGQRNGASTLADILIQTSRTNTNRKLYHESIHTAPFEPPLAIAPVEGSNMLSSTPQVIGRLRSTRPYPQVPMTLQFQVDYSPTFSAPDTFESEKYLAINDVDTATGYSSLVSTIIPDSAAITPGVAAYLRMRDYDAMGNTGPWSDPVSFLVSHPPVATNMTPVQNAFLQRDIDDNIIFSWTFTDPSESDTQSAFQIVVRKASDKSVVFDSGKQLTSDNYYVHSIGDAYVDVDLTWDLVLWDSFDTKGKVAGPLDFKVENPPDVSITSPANLAVVGTPVAHVDFDVNTSGGATVKSTRVVITQGSQTLFDVTTVRANDPSGTSYSVSSPGQVYHNLGKYTIQVYATDSRDFIGKSDPIQISASWVPPDMPTTVPGIDLTHFNVEGEGYVSVLWDDSGKDTDFVLYTLQRKDDMIDVVTGDVIVEGVWKDIYTTYDNDPTYEYHDYLAPATNYKVSYRLTQGATIYEDIVMSDPGPTSYDFPESENYWLVDPDLADGFSGAMLLFNVSADSYTEEYESETYHVMGRGNHTDFGDRLGYNGSLTAQLRNSGSTSARAKKIALEAIKLNRRSLYLRTPFGDVKLVTVGNLGVSRIAGVGVSEFCEVTIPYQEVAP